LYYARRDRGSVIPLHKQLVPKLSAEQKEIEKLKRENQRLQDKLQMANDCLGLQKKALSMLDRMNNGNDT